MDKYQEIIEDIDILDELEKRGQSGRKIGDNLMICCPFHGEKTPSLGIAYQGSRKGRFQCFSCHERGNFFHIIALLDETTFREAIGEYNKEFSADIETVNELRDHFLNFLKSSDDTKAGKIRIINPEILSLFKSPYGVFSDYLHGKRRKLSDDTIERWQILCCDKDFPDRKLYWKDRVIVPMFDSKHRLISILARSIHDDDKSEKVRKLKGGERKKILVGIPFIERGTTLVLVEGEFDAIYLQQNGVPAVSIGTTTISDIQIHKIVKFTDSVALSLDGDTYKFFNKKGENIRKEVYNKLSRFVKVDVIQLPKNKDPNELSSDEVSKIYSKYIRGIKN